MTNLHLSHEHKRAGRYADAYSAVKAAIRDITDAPATDDALANAPDTGGARQWRRPRRCPARSRAVETTSPAPCYPRARCAGASDATPRPNATSSKSATARAIPTSPHFGTAETAYRRVLANLDARRRSMNSPDAR